MPRFAWWIERELQALRTTKCRRSPFELPSVTGAAHPPQCNSAPAGLRLIGKVTGSCLSAEPRHPGSREPAPFAVPVKTAPRRLERRHRCRDLTRHLAQAREQHVLPANTGVARSAIACSIRPMACPGRPVRTSATARLFRAPTWPGSSPDPA